MRRPLVIQVSQPTSPLREFVVDLAYVHRLQRGVRGGCRVDMHKTVLLLTLPRGKGGSQRWNDEDWHQMPEF